jgi:quinol-cytochrome oxidoreductase complex cytochrome b subunit
MAFLGLHLFFVQKHGMSVPPDVEREGGAKRVMPFMPNFLLRDVVGWLSALAVLAALAAYFPAELGQKADPFQPAPAGIKPEWYFMFMFQTLKLLPGHILGIEGELLGILAFGLGGLFLAAIPFLELWTARGGRGRLFTWIAVAIILYMVALTYIGYTVSPTK